jgi:hypothetical protein
MPEFTVRSDSINVEQIMEQIRARIREKRGVDYTEEQIRELAAVKLEKFLDPRHLRSDLLDQFRRAKPAYEPPELPNYSFEDDTLFQSHRPPVRWVRRLLQPVLKLFFNPNPLIRALHIQSRLNTAHAEREATREATRRELDQLYYELIHNLVLEATRLAIEVRNLTMRIESVAGRLEFNERRARALESVVAYRPSDEPDTGEQAGETGSASSTPPPQQPLGTAEGPGQRSRRRRRRRGRRGGSPPASSIMTPAGPRGSQAGEALSPEPSGSTAAGPEAARAAPPADLGQDATGNEPEPK